ncbi:MAG: transposase, partial [Anoxybacillus mongoliensis]|nr:transposase [Anoxybacillus mongoliensis]
MTSLLPQLLIKMLQIIKIQYQIIIYLLGVLFGKSLTDWDDEEPVNQSYQKLQVDELPVIETLPRLDYRQLLVEYEQQHGKPLKPIKRHTNTKTTVPDTLTCPQCQAPSAYVYANNGGKGQYQCKVCHCRFNHRSRFAKEVIFRCPHCLKALEKIKERNDYYIHKCKNDDCSFYQANLRQMTPQEKEQFQHAPHAFKVRYIFREFLFDFQPLAPSSPIQTKVDLSRLSVSSHTLGLILTYH